MKTSRIQLTSEQQRAFQQISDWISNNQGCEFRLAGLAGTGKTTLISQLIPHLGATHTVAVCSPTGKAAHVLTSKGVTATTIHRLIYDSMQDDSGEWVRVKRDRLLCNMIVCDEASMVSSELYVDLRSYDLPILWVGDHGQLEPVGDDPRILAEPDIKLETIVRQAASNPIIPFSHSLRRGEAIARQDSDPRLIVTDPATAANEFIDKVDQVLVGTNTTRHKLNAAFREHLGFVGPMPQAGDRLICLKNNYYHNVFNGQIATVRANPRRYNASTVLCSLQFEGTNEVLDSIPIWTPTLGRGVAADERIPAHITHWDWGYAITAHKAQGSEWDRVLVFEPSVGGWAPWDVRRWSYTAATRASKQLIYAADRVL